MTDRYHKPRAGEPMKLSPEMWGDVVDLVRKTKGAGGNTAVPWRPSEREPALVIDNWQSGTLDQYALAHFKAITNNADSDWQFQPLVEFDAYNSGGHKFDAGTVLHAAQARSATNDVIRSYAAGIVPATIYVHSEKHRFCDAPYMTVNSDGSGGPLQLKYWETDWDGPHQILWKESGTGEKKALLRLGENRPRLLWGRTKEAWRKRGGIPSQGYSWAYVNVELMDYTSGTSGPESPATVRVLLPTNYDQDPNVPANMILGFQKAYQRSERQFYSGFDINNWPTYRYAAVTANYASAAIGDCRIILTEETLTTLKAGWAPVNGTQNTAKTMSGLAPDASDKFLLFQKYASQNGGGGPATFLSADVFENLGAHPPHIHGILRAQNAEAGSSRWHVSDPDTTANSAQNHFPVDADHEVEIEVPKPAWQGAQLYERIDNSAGDEE